MYMTTSRSTENRRTEEGALARLHFGSVPSRQKTAIALAKCWFPEPSGSAASRLEQVQARGLLAEAIHLRMVLGDPDACNMEQVRADIAQDSVMASRPGIDTLQLNLTDGRYPLVINTWHQAIERGRTEKPTLGTTHKFAPDIEHDLAALRQVSTRHGLLACVSDWAVIALAIGAAVGSSSFLPVPVTVATVAASVVVIGARMRGLATLVHESAHKTLARPRWLNTALGSVCSGWWVLQSRSRYHRSHVREHHPHLGDERRDPDTRQYLKQKLRQQDPRSFFRRNLLETLSGAKTLVNLPYLLRDRLLPEKGATLSREEKIEGVGLVFAWCLLLALLWYFGLLGWFLLLWVLPYLTSFQCLNWLIEVSEHFPLIWRHKDPFLHTRNRKGPGAEQFLTGIHGERWHRVHHLRPDIPFHNLEAAHEIMMRDRAYAASEATSGGLFFRGPRGEPAIVNTIKADLGFL